MTTKWPSSCLYAVSSINIHRQTAARIACGRNVTLVRFYAQQQQHRKLSDSQSQPDVAKQYDALKSAPARIVNRAQDDPINPPLTTVPPPLNVPQEQGSDNFFAYWFKVGRAYGTFYKEGLKAVWSNRKAAKMLRERLVEDVKAQGTMTSTADTLRKNMIPDGGSDTILSAVAQKAITRSEYQLLERYRYDVGKLPLFGVLVLIFGEWLPLLVPFIPGAVPGTCRIPKQVQGMRQKAEERRRVSFRQGIAEPTKEQLAVSETDSESMGGTVWPLARPQYAQTLLRRLRDDQLLHLSSTLGVHNRLWDRLQLPPPSALLRRGLAKKLQYITTDDILLLQCGGVSKLVSDEVMVAAEERGLDVLGRKDAALREQLAWWLNRQQEDGGRGRAVIDMLFRR